MPTLQIIGAPQSNFVWSVRILAEEKGVAYELAPERPHQGEAARINPFGKIPVMKHGDFELSESRAIAGYIDATFPGPKLFPTEPKAAAEVERWVSVGNMVVDPCLIRRFVSQYAFPRGPDGQPDRSVIDPAVKEMGPLLAKLDSQVAKTGFLAGDAFSYADCNIIPMVFYTSRFAEGKEAVAACANLTAYLGRMAPRPSVQAAKPPPPKQ